MTCIFIYLYLYEIIYIYVSQTLILFVHMYQISGTMNYRYCCVSAKELTETNKCYLIIPVEFRQLCKVTHIKNQIM